MDFIALTVCFSMTYILCAMITYLFGWCVFHVSDIDSKPLLIVLSVIWVIGLFYIVYEGNKK